MEFSLVCNTVCTGKCSVSYLNTYSAPHEDTLLLGFSQQVMHGHIRTAYQHDLRSLLILTRLQSHDMPRSTVRMVLHYSVMLQINAYTVHTVPANTLPPVLSAQQDRWFLLPTLQNISQTSTCTHTHTHNNNNTTRFHPN